MHMVSCLPAIHKLAGMSQQLYGRPEPTGQHNSKQGNATLRTAPLTMYASWLWHLRLTTGQGTPAPLGRRLDAAPMKGNTAGQGWLGQHTAVVAPAPTNLAGHHRTLRQALGFAHRETGLLATASPTCSKSLAVGRDATSLVSIMPMMSRSSWE